LNAYPTYVPDAMPLAVVAYDTLFVNLGLSKVVSVVSAIVLLEVRYVSPLVVSLE
jgi:hypothetical protein